VCKRGGVEGEHVGFERLKVGEAQLEAQHAEGCVKGASGDVLGGKLAADEPALRNGQAGGGGDEGSIRGCRCGHVSWQVEVLHGYRGMQ
jgi:hypothetical protein